MRCPWASTYWPGLATNFAWQPALGGQAPFAIAYDHFRYFVHEDANWDWRNFDLARDTALSDEKDKHFAALSPDLKAFQQRGGKLLMWHGWNDQLISPFNTINYYTNVAKRMGASDTDDFLRLFMAPGMQHCAGGVGPNTFDALSALERWVEQSQKPSEIVATHATHACAREFSGLSVRHGPVRRGSAR